MFISRENIFQQTSTFKHPSFGFLIEKLEGKGKLKIGDKGFGGGVMKKVVHVFENVAFLL